MNQENVDVIIVGGGPSGVAAAVELRREGIKKVVILEREQYLGGATRHCSHSPFGMLEFGRVYLGASYGKRLEREAAQHGVDVRYGHSVVKLHDDGTLDVTANNGLKTFTAKRVMVATGARETPRSARLLPGDRPIGVVTTGTLQSYVAFHGLMPFHKPLIVGSELVSLSALFTCLTHGARPVAMIEPRTHALAKAPLTWFPRLMGVPFHRSAEILDIRGNGRVSSVLIRYDGREEEIECDGVLLTGQFTPEASLYRQSATGVDRGSFGPATDQNGRTMNPLYFSAGNVLRGVETGGWAFREGRAVGRAIANDLRSEPEVSQPVKVSFDEPMKLVVPGIIRSGTIQGAAFKDFQLRFNERVRGTVVLLIDGKEVWKSRKLWKPERRFLVPIPETAALAKTIKFEFRGEA